MNIKEYQLQQQEIDYNTTKENVIKRLKGEIERYPYVYSCKIKPTPFYPFLYHDIQRHYDRLIEDLKQEGINLKHIEEYSIISGGFLFKREKKVFNSKYYILSWD